MAKNILIVEDSVDLQDLLSQHFEAEGYEPSRAYNGKQALEFLRTTPILPSLILLDIMMPVMDGIEFRQAQLKDPRLATIPVVVMTADTNYEAKMKQLHTAELIRKPISNVTKLFEVVEKHRRAD